MCFGGLKFKAFRLWLEAHCPVKDIGSALLGDLARVSIPKGPDLIGLHPRSSLVGLITCIILWSGARNQAKRYHGNVVTALMLRTNGLGTSNLRPLSRHH